MNKKISKLDRKLQQYTQLVCESRASEQSEDEALFVRPPSSEGREIIERKGMYHYTDQIQSEQSEDI